MGKIIKFVNNAASKAQIGNNKVDAYFNLQKLYNDFLAQMKKSDIANSPRRYMTEIALLKKVQLAGIEQKQDVSQWKSIEEQVREKFKKEWGIELLDDVISN